MPYNAPRDVTGFVAEMLTEARLLRWRAAKLLSSATKRANVEKLGNRREDLCETRRKVAAALKDAADLLEQRAFADFGEDMAEAGFDRAVRSSALFLKQRGIPAWRKPPS